ncbi:pirin family protein [Pseudothauera nasutitermitis]|uniref:Pirin family protein n=1 Tax=Pseudothauera nasutitermitis TaxID=2565930 RepID=A0A4S4ATW7_9RHOO|nr:pirin family protein [Pseudothauera nasutitermitis]THF62946.1 pirin family protein [Pseudothauera nasutitermitis]
MIELVLDGRRSSLGGGVDVLRVLPQARRRMVGPFVFYDHAGPLSLAPGQVSRADVRPHPHIGLATISYLLSGMIVHRDSLGITQEIRPGDVNWMTAGRGISHSERFHHPESFEGGGLELLQAWVALPVEHAEVEPAFDHYPADALPVFDQDGARVRVIAGTAWGRHSPVRTLSPLFYAHAELPAGASLTPPDEYSERALYVAAGSVEVDGCRLVHGQLAVFEPGACPPLRANEDATLMLLGGEPVGERFVWWNFVASTRERIERAKDEWRSGRFPLPPHDHEDLIPLPE